jgi:hemoglobin
MRLLERLLRKPKASLYDRLGPEAVDAAVDSLYRKVLADKRLSRFFEDADLDRLRHKQKVFVSMAIGGPIKYNGADLGKAHAHLLKWGLNDQHYDWVLDHLRTALWELHVGEDDIAVAIQGLERYRDEVMGRR